jgi:tripartite-type tricarboxylate transporter receptor subunit TctC
MLTRRQTVASALASAVFPPAIQRASAAVIDRQAHMIVGFAAGGGTDVSARLIAERLREDYASVVIVDNKTGASSRPAVDFVKHAAPDGATMLFTTDFPITLFPHIFKKLEYDSINDFIPVAPVTKSSLVVSVGPAVPAEVTSIKALIEWMKANPAKANFGTTGNGGTPHFVGVMLANASNVPIAAVHYRGGAPALQDLMGGHVSMSVNPSGEAIPMARGGGIRILAVASPERSRFLPDTPTLLEQGYNVAINTWSGVFLPAKTPAPIVNGLSAALEKIVKSSDMIEAQAKLGNEMTFLQPAAFATQVREDIAKWGPVVKASGFEPED